ncbi:MAG: type III toxin-antitoxin system ToxN/AbiQ family toxin [Candidatus Gastranaerophilaceae bacterium]
MEIYGKQLYLYRINIDYIKYLHNFDKEVYYDEEDKDYENKPYLGIIVSNNGYKYFIPLTSAKEKHKNMMNSGDNYIMIYEKISLQDSMKIDTQNWISKIMLEQNTFIVKHILSILDIKKMIPVPDGVFHKENIDSMKDTGRKRLLLKEYEFLSPMKEKILKKADKLYLRQLNNNKIFTGYCNFSLLEEASKKYES